MTYKCLNFILFLIFARNSDAKIGFGPGEQDWGYVSVRPNASLFWWLYYTTANVTSFYEKPLVIWIDGGPGDSGTGYGNFELIGSLDSNLKPREHNWVKEYNVLFIDSPAGVGFSHVDDEKALATTNKQTTEDLLTCIKDIFEKDPNLKKVQSYIVGDSYGGKVIVEFARIWYDAEKAGEIESQLKGVAPGAPWISAKDTFMNWAPYLFQTGLIDDKEYEAVEKAASLTAAEIDKGNWIDAMRFHRQTIDIIKNYTHVDFGNILNNVTYDQTEYKEKEIEEEKNLKSLMNDVKSKLNLTTVWGEQSSLIFESHKSEFLRPVTSQVEYLLDNTDIKVYVYSGQLDLLVCSSGVLQWVNNLRWKNRDEWHSTVRKPLIVNNIVEGYVKKYGNLAMYWIRRSGHRASSDNPVAMLEIMAKFTEISTD